MARAWSASAPLTEPTNGAGLVCCSALAATEDLQP
jgi:hypothetical protein